MPQELPLPLPGTVVGVRGRRWRVLDAARHGDCGLCRLADVRHDARVRHLSLLVPFDRLATIAPAPDPVARGRRHAMAVVASHLARLTRDATLRAAATARVDLLPYQLEPVLAVLRGETRLLIADEVGLGKTIEAGLILAEVFARDPSSRCLVTAPASLCLQWVGELRDRFHLPAVHIDRAALQRLACSMPPGSIVWDQQALAVSSFDFIKRPEVRRHLARLRWDALVVDEAHMASLAPERAAAVAALAARARRLVLLTATPHACDTDGFRALCDIGRLAAEPPVLVFRRTRPDVDIASRRRVHLLRIRTTAAERRMHRALDRYTLEVWRATDGNDRERGGARLAMIVLRKRAASGPSALLASLSRRLAFIESRDEASPGRQLLLPLDHDEDLDPADDEPSGTLAAPGLHDAEAECGRLARLIELARRACAAESKLAALTRLVRRAREPVIVFTEYRDTLARLAARLPTTRPPAVLHGGLNQAERQAVILAFTRGEAPILLATDAAAHGLNLQARCRLVVNMELPWMPSRLEQRAGRVDRIGQQRRVHVVHLVSRQTCEATVLARLVLRVARERAVLGSGLDPVGTAEAEELETARTVFEDTRDDVPRVDATVEMFRRVDLGAEARDERARLEFVRALLDSRSKRRSRRAQPERVGARGACWTVLRRRRGFSKLPLGLLCLFSARFMDGRGSLLEEMLVLLHVSLAPAIGCRRVLERAMPALLEAVRLPLQRLAAQQTAGRLAILQSHARERVTGLASREAAMGDHDDEEAPVQAGLFDRRATRRADEDRRQRRGDSDEEAHRLESLERALTVEAAGDPELVVVLGLAQ